jgi:hypothetical protein
VLLSNLKPLALVRINAERHRARRFGPRFVAIAIARLEAAKDQSDHANDGSRTVATGRRRGHGDGFLQTKGAAQVGAIAISARIRATRRGGAKDALPG